MTANRFFVPALVLLSLAACDGRPAHEKFPGPPGQTTEIQQAQSQQAVLGGGNNPAANAPVLNNIAPHAMPSDGANPGGAPVAAANNPNAVIEGVVQLEPGTKPKGTYLFVAVRSENGGPPLAVRREQHPKLPYKFKLTASDVMIPGTPFEGNVVVTARLKQEADPLSHKPGDWAGNVMTKVGDRKVRVILNQPTTE